MQRKLVILFTVFVVGLFLAIPACAHTPLLLVEDNWDGTVYLEGGYSDGSSAAGITVLLVEDKHYEGDPEGKDIWEGKLVLLRTKFDEYSEATVDKPNVPYTIWFIGGPGHNVSKEGPALESDERETPLLLVEDNKDGTISLEGNFTNRSSAGFTILLVEDKVYKGDKKDKKFYKDKLVLLETKLDEEGKLTLDKPEVPYLIVLDVPGYVTEITGP